MQTADLDRLIEEAAKAFRTDVAYAEHILFSAKTVQLKRQTWAAREAAKPKLPPKPTKISMYNVDDLLAELEATG